MTGEDDDSEGVVGAGAAGEQGRVAGLVLVAVLIGGVVAGSVSAVAAGVLADRYHPSAPGVESFLLPARVREVDRWADVHHLAVILLSILSSLTAVVVVAQRLRRRVWLRRHVTSAIAAVGAALLAWHTTALVRWDQLGLWAVTAGGEVDGYWAAAFDDGVRFVVVDNAEVSPSSYATALVVHLVAPVAAALGLAWLLVRQAMLVGRRASASVQVAAGEPGRRRSP